MRHDLVLPEVGLDPNLEMRVSLWFVEKGDEVLEGDRLVEILAGSITFDVPNPVNGRVVDILMEEEDVVRVGDVLAIVEAEEEEEGAE